MPQHKKPTKEELKAQEEVAIAEAEKLEETPEEEPEPEVTPKTSEVEEEEEESPQIEEEEEEEQAEPSEEEKEALEKKLEAEKQKSSASARENQKIYAKNRRLNRGITEANEIPEPTDAEMQKIRNDWDILSDFEKEMAVEVESSKRWKTKIAEAQKEATKIEKWNESVEEFVSDPKTLNDNPELEGKTDEFKEFATAESNNSVPFNILVSAFLHENSKTRPSNKGRMFEKGAGGSNEKPTPKDGSISLEEGRKLRESDYNKWKEYLNAGKIKSDL